MNAQRIRLPATLTDESLAGLARALDTAVEAATARVIVLHGSDGVFSRGASFQGLLDGEGAEAESAAFAKLLDRIVTAPVPVIAEIDGRATAGGVGLAAAADFVLASDRAEFSLTEALFGAVPAIIAPILLRRLTPAKLTLWTLSAESWDAPKACAAGLADEAVPSEELAKTSASWQRRLQRAQPDAVGALKRFVHQASALRSVDGAKITAKRFRDPRVLERIRAFEEDGAAPWLEESS